MKTFLLEVFSVISRLTNVLTGGTADVTFSARSHLEELWTEQVIDFVAYWVFNEEDHCKVWWESEVRRSKRNISLNEARHQVQKEIGHG